jgi:hypothetical protein
MILITAFMALQPCPALELKDKNYAAGLDDGIAIRNFINTNWGFALKLSGGYGAPNYVFGQLYTVERLEREDGIEISGKSDSVGRKLDDYIADFRFGTSFEVFYRQILSKKVICHYYGALGFSTKQLLRETEFESAASGIVSSHDPMPGKLEQKLLRMFGEIGMEPGVYFRNKFSLQVKIGIGIMHYTIINRGKEVRNFYNNKLNEYRSIWAFYIRNYMLNLSRGLVFYYYF